MQQDKHHNTQIDQNDIRRRERLLEHTNAPARTHQQSYTIFIRRMRLFLPLVAVILIVALMTWPESNDNIVATKDEQKKQYENVQKNELLNPKFESVDEKNQPFTITADTAIQNDQNKDLLMLTNPHGILLLNSNKRVTIASEEGFYQQEQQKLRLKDAVHLTHDDGYNMTMAELFVDMQNSIAHSETPVTGAGPQGTLRANGLKADHANNTITFTGPARLVIQDMALMDGLSGSGKQGE